MQKMAIENTSPKDKINGWHRFERCRSAGAGNVNEAALILRPAGPAGVSGTALEWKSAAGG